MKPYISKHITLTLIAIVMALSTSCNSNNGDIGPWYGHWKLTEIRIDGNIDTQYPGNIFWAFQNSVVQMTEVYGSTSQNHWGSWSQADGILTLDFDNHDDQSIADPSTAWRYEPPKGIYLATDINRLSIDKLTDSQIVLTNPDYQGKVITYYLRSWE